MFRNKKILVRFHTYSSKDDKVYNNRYQCRLLHVPTDKVSIEGIIYNVVQSTFHMKVTEEVESYYIVKLVKDG